jgi:hypothetical protein
LFAGELVKIFKVKDMASEVANSLSAQEIVTQQIRIMLRDRITSEE